MKRLTNLMLGVFIGGLIGSAIAMLLAPASGETLRRKVLESFIEMQEEMRTAATSRRAELEKQLADLRAPRK